MTAHWSTRRHTNGIFLPFANGDAVLAMSMLDFHINRAGRNLREGAARHATLERAKQKLHAACGRCVMHS